MAKHLKNDDVEKVLAIISGWRGGITWQLLVVEVGKVLGFAPVRQTLARDIRIKTAFGIAKERSAEAGKEVVPDSLRAAAQRIARLEAENARYAAENEQLLLQFYLWRYNAYAHGVTDEKLNRPLPNVDRGRTE